MLRLRGLVPSEEDRRTVLGMVKAHFADLEVEDRLKIAEGGPPREQWLGAVSFGLKQLSHLKQGSTRLLNAGLKVDGEARSAPDYAEVKKALSGPMPTGLTILSDHVRPPLVDPFVFSATLGPNALVMTGSVPSEESRKDLKELSRHLFERPIRQRFCPAGALCELRGLRLQAQVAGVEFGQQVAAMHGVADIHETPGEVATDAERQRAFLAGAHFAGESQCRRLRAAAGMHHQHRACRHRRCIGATAGGERRRQAQCHGQREWFPVDSDDRHSCPDAGRQINGLAGMV